MTGDIWVARCRQRALSVIRRSISWSRDGCASNATIADDGGPLAVVEDAWGDLFLADAAHRVVIYYPGLGPINAANFLNPNVLAPGMIAALFTPGQLSISSAARPRVRRRSAAAHAAEWRSGAVQRLAGAAVLCRSQPDQFSGSDERAAKRYGRSSGYGDRNGPRAGRHDRRDDARVTRALHSGGQWHRRCRRAQSGQHAQHARPIPPCREASSRCSAPGQGFIAGAPPDGTHPERASSSTAGRPRVIMGTDVRAPARTSSMSGLAPDPGGRLADQCLIPDTVITTADESDAA